MIVGLTPILSWYVMDNESSPTDHQDLAYIHVASVISTGGWIGLRWNPTVPDLCQRHLHVYLKRQFLTGPRFSYHNRCQRRWEIPIGRIILSLDPPQVEIIITIIIIKEKKEKKNFLQPTLLSLGVYFFSCEKWQAKMNWLYTIDRILISYKRNRNAKFFSTAKAKAKIHGVRSPLIA